MAKATLEIEVKVEGEEGVKKLSVDLKETGSSAAETSKKFGASFGAIGSGAKVAAGIVVGAFAAVTAAITASVLSLTNFAGPITDLAAKTGTSTTFLQEMALAGGQVGVSMDAVGASALKLQKTLGDVNGISKTAAAALGDIGLSLKDLQGLNPSEQFDLVASALSKVDDQNKLVAAGTALMGRGFTEILPLIKSNIEEVRKEAQELGITIDADVVAAADRMGDRFDILGQALLASGKHLGGVIVQNQAFQMAVEAVIDVVGALNQWIIANQDAISSWVTAGILVAAQALELTLNIIGGFITGLADLALATLAAEKTVLDWSIALLESPIAQMIPGLGALRESFLSVAQALKANVEENTMFVQGVRGVGEAITGAGGKVGEFQQKLLAQIASGKGAETATRDLSGAVDTLGDDLETAGTKTDAFTQKVNSLKDSLGTAGLVTEANAAVEAIKQLGGVSEVSRQGMEQIAAVVEKLRQNGLPVPPVLAAMASQLEILKTQGSATAESIGLVVDEVNGFIDQIPVATAGAREMAEAMGRFGETNADYVQIGRITKDTIKETTTEAASFEDGMAAVNDVLSEARGFMELFGISADSTFGRVIGWVSKAFDSFNSLTGIIGKIGGLFGGGGGGGGFLSGIMSLFGGGGGAAASTGAATTAATGGIVSSIGGAFASVGSAVATGVTTAASAIGGAVATAGSTVIGAVAPVLAAIPVAGWVALAGVGIGLLVKKFFGGRDAQTVAEEAGRDLGVEVSEGLAESIHKGGKNIQLSLSAIFAEGKLSVDAFAQEIGDIFSVFEQGKVSKEDALAALATDSQTLLANLGQVGASGVEQMERILAAADRLGLSFQGIDQFAAAYVQRAGELGIPINNVVLSALGLDAALGQVAATTGGVDAAFQALPETAAASVEGISAAFTQGSAAITEGLNPVADKIATEIRGAGEQTSAAIQTSFTSTNAAIQSGLSTIATTFSGSIVAGANSATSATMRLAEAARAAASATASIDFPGGPTGGFGVGPTPVQAAGGFNSPELPRDTLIQAHKGEQVNIGEPGKTGNQVTIGGVTVMLNGGGGKGVASADIDQLIKALEKNQNDNAEKLKRILGLR